MLGSPKYHHTGDDIEINAGRPTVTLTVTNTGDRGIQVGSHFHFFEANRALMFERELAYGMHLDIPAGTGVRFEPGDTREVTLTAYAGSRRVIGFNSLADGGLDAEQTRADAMTRMTERGFKDGKLTARPSGKGTAKGSSKGSSSTSNQRSTKKTKGKS